MQSSRIIITLVSPQIKPSLLLQSFYSTALHLLPNFTSSFPRSLNKDLKIPNLHNPLHFPLSQPPLKHDALPIDSKIIRPALLRSALRPRLIVQLTEPGDQIIEQSLLVRALPVSRDLDIKPINHDLLTERACDPVDAVVGGCVGAERAQVSALGAALAEEGEERECERAGNVSVIEKIWEKSLISTSVDIVSSPLRRIWRPKVQRAVGSAKVVALDAE